MDRDRRSDAGAADGRGAPHVWRWTNLLPLAEQAGELVPVGRGGERRAIALANPGSGGRPFATPTLWAAIQYLMPGRGRPRAPPHPARLPVRRRGRGRVDGRRRRPGADARGDFLRRRVGTGTPTTTPPTPPMAWIDGLDIPLQSRLEAQFFEFGREQRRPDERPPGAVPLRAAVGPSRAAAAVAHRRDDRRRHCSRTDGSTPTAALTEQLALEAEGHAAPSSPATRPCATPTRPPAATRCRRSAPRCTGFGRGASSTARAARSARRSSRCSTARPVHRRRARLARRPRRPVRRAVLAAVVRALRGRRRGPDSALDLFRFSDAPVFEALDLDRAD